MSSKLASPPPSAAQLIPEIDRLIWLAVHALQPDPLDSSTRAFLRADAGIALLAASVHVSRAALCLNACP